MKQLDENKITYAFIGVAMKVYNKLGPGLLESAYCECLAYELKQANIQFEREKPVPLVYEEIKLDYGYRLDFLIEKTVVVEVKSVEAINPVHMSQIITYLKLGNYRRGLLINFNVANLQQGIKRVVNGY